MTEEEKKAINRIYDVTHQTDGSYVDYIDIDDTCNYEEDLDSCKGFCKAIDIALNIIDRQQKEIEYEKELRVRYERRYDMCKESKDKLKKEIEELKEYKWMYEELNK